MKMTTKKTAALSASMLMAVGGIGGVFAAAMPAEAQEAPETAGQESPQESASESAVVKLDAVEGSFGFTQAAVAQNDYIAKVIGAASKYLCGSQVAEMNENAAPEDWVFEVKGAVSNPGEISLAEFRESGFAHSLVMGCTCVGNPVDGTATANAEVTGVPIADLMRMVEPAEGVNTIVFRSADGYEVALPLSYVQQHYSSIVFAVNDAPLAESVGGVNQLWLGSTPASYFARDIVSVEFQERQTPPPSPTSEAARAEYKNLPNIGVLYGGEVR